MTEGTARDDAAVPRLIQSLGYALVVFHATLLGLEPGSSEAHHGWATDNEGCRVRFATAERLLRDAGAVLRSQRYWSPAWEVDGNFVSPPQVAARAAATLLSDSSEYYSTRHDGLLLAFQTVRRPLVGLGEGMEDEFRWAIEGVWEARNADKHTTVTSTWIRQAAYDHGKLLFGPSPWPRPA
jgi:hypothetical protein